MISAFIPKNLQHHGEIKTMCKVGDNNIDFSLQ